MAEVTKMESRKRTLQRATPVTPPEPPPVDPVEIEPQTCADRLTMTLGAGGLAVAVVYACTRDDGHRDAHLAAGLTENGDPPTKRSFAVTWR